MHLKQIFSHLKKYFLNSITQPLWSVPTAHFETIFSITIICVRSGVMLRHAGGNLTLTLTSMHHPHRGVHGILGIPKTVHNAKTTYFVKNHWNWLVKHKYKPGQASKYASVNMFPPATDESVCGGGGGDKQNAYLRHEWMQQYPVNTVTVLEDTQLCSHCCTHKMNSVYPCDTKYVCWIFICSGVRMLMTSSCHQMHL